jgi:hypothetical protein
MATIKQKLAVQKTVENGGSVSRAMLDAGYKPATAKNPSKLTESKAWPALLEKYLPDEKLLATHDEALEATKIFSSHTEPDKEIPDHPTRLKAVELAYKVKNKYIQADTQINMQVNFLEYGTKRDPAPVAEDSNSGQE